MRWLPVDAAVRQVTYDHDVRVLRDFAALPPVTAVLTLVRHAEAGKRATWPGPDTARQLDAVGTAQAQALAPLLAVGRPERLLSASVRRCVQTIEPLAEVLDLPIEIESAFDEPDPGQSPDNKALIAATRLAELAGAGTAAAVCSQGKVIPDMLAGLAGTGPADYVTPKGTGWLLAFAADRLVAADRLATHP
jgi:8-oxo-dGTP diphosphatase